MALQRPAPRSRPGFLRRCLLAAHYSAPGNVCPPALSSSSSCSSAQRSCCGPAARAAGEPLGDSLSCHFLCVARRILEGSQRVAAPLAAGARATLSSVAPPGRGRGRLRDQCLLCSRGAPHTRSPTKKSTGAETARCLQSRLGRNQSARHGGGMWSPSGGPLLPVP